MSWKRRCHCSIKLGNHCEGKETINFDNKVGRAISAQNCVKSRAEVNNIINTATWTS